MSKEFFAHHILSASHASQLPHVLHHELQHQDEKIGLPVSAIVSLFQTRSFSEHGAERKSNRVRALEAQRKLLSVLAQELGQFFVEGYVHGVEHFTQQNQTEKVFQTMGRIFTMTNALEQNQRFITQYQPQILESLVGVQGSISRFDQIINFHTHSVNELHQLKMKHDLVKNQIELHKDQASQISMIVFLEELLHLRYEYVQQVLCYSKFMGISDHHLLNTSLFQACTAFRDQVLAFTLTLRRIELQCQVLLQSAPVSENQLLQNQVKNISVQLIKVVEEIDLIQFCK